MSHSLQSKVVRPGSMNYSYYHSQRTPVVNSSAAKLKKSGHRRALLSLLVVVVALAGGGAAYAYKQANTKQTLASTSKPAPSVAPKTTAPITTPAIAAATPATNYCASNTLNENVIVSISARHLWACDGTTSEYDSPVVTGIAYLAADKTPTGTYHIYGKVTNTVLTGSDTTGSWSDPVSYWMPFLDNQYGAYGFHDATWRSESDFGTIDPNSPNGSHGCVELPLATAAWLYNWAQIGTTVTIES